MANNNAKTIKYFVGIDERSCWATFDTEEQVNQWLADNAVWKRSIGNEEIEVAEYENRKVHVYETAIRSSGSGESMGTVWVPSQHFRTSRTKAVRLNTAPARTAQEVSVKTYIVEGPDPDEQTIYAEAASVVSAVIVAARQANAEGIYRIDGEAWQASRGGRQGFRVRAA